MFLLKLRLSRYLLTIIRLIYFAKKNRTKIIKKNSKHSKKGTVERNIKSALSLRDCYSGERSSFFLTKYLDYYEVTKRENQKVLLVGPRNEGEIFNFLARGFQSKNIDAIDLFSYSPKIQIRDMHKINEIRKKYDLIYFGFILNYSKKVNLVLKKSLKILNQNGMIGISLETDNWNYITNKTKKLFKKKLKFNKFEALERINKNYIYKNIIFGNLKKVFLYTYIENLGFNFQKKKCVTILLKRNNSKIYKFNK